MRRLWLVVCIGLAHALLTLSLTVLVFGDGMSRWDSGDTPSLGIRLADLALSILGLPLLPLVASLPLGAQPSGFPWDHLLLLANGTLWGLLLVGLLHWRRTAGPSANR